MGRKGVISKLKCIDRNNMIFEIEGAATFNDVTKSVVNGEICYSIPEIYEEYKYATILDGRAFASKDKYNWFAAISFRVDGENITDHAFIRECKSILN